MDYRRRLLLFFFVNFIDLIVAPLEFNYYFCLPHPGANDSTSTAYEANLRTLLSSLSSNISVDGFYNASAGQNSDQVNAVALCRGDVELDICRSCINDSTEKILQRCPNYKEAIGWYDYCMLRYSNRSIFGTLETSPTSYFHRNISSNVNKFNQVLNSLLGTLSGEAAAGGSLRKFATGNTTIPGYTTIYGLLQCTPDLSEDDCVACLANMASIIPQCCNGSLGTSLQQPNCNLEYEVFLFYNQTSSAIGAPPSSPASNGTPAIVAPPPSPVSNGTPAIGAPPSSPGHGSSKTRTVLIIVVSTTIFAILTICIFCIFLTKWKQNKPKEKIESAEDICFKESLQYDFSTIQAATDNFSDSNKLGEGGFGSVYKARLPNGHEIAVKRLSRDSGQGDVQFKNEVALVAKLQHRSLVGILGFCMEGAERLLIYELVPNASLDHFIFDPRRRACLDWDRRYKIIEGIARGLLYLHEDSRHRIIHRDLKASNVLLDEKLNPKIADFGMARLFMRDETQGTTSMIVGTYGYMAPEYAMQGQFSVKSDVFSFGVLVLEIISGQRNDCYRAGTKVEELPTCVIFQAWKNWQSGTASNIADATLRDGSAGSLQAITRCIHIALLCVQENVAHRPTMASVVFMLNNSSLISLPLPSEPAFFKHNTIDSGQYKCH